jgi:hypothetical protein
MKHFRIASLLALALLASVPAIAQLRVTAGAKAWYAAWNIPIPYEQGVEQSAFDPAFMLGPYLSLRYGHVSLTGMYSTSLLHFEATAKNPGSWVMGFNGVRRVSRQDINLFLNYAISNEFTAFLNYKRLDYTFNDAMTYITGMQARSTQKFAGTGFGAGVQVTVPFGGGSPLYSFMSLGAVANSYKSDEATVTIVGYQPVTQKVDYKGDELLYFVDAGVGMRFMQTPFGGALGIRVENAKDTRAIFGPTMNLFYTF